LILRVVAAPQLPVEQLERLVGKRTLSSVLFFATALLAVIPSVAVPDAATDARLAELTARIEQYPGEQVWLIQRARVYVDANDYELALDDIRAARALGNPSEAAFVHGILLYRSGELVAAREQLDAYLAIHPGHRSALEYRARLLRDAGHYEAALSDYRQLLAIDPDLDPGYYLSTARILAALPEYGTGEALALLDGRMADVGPISSLQRYAIELEKQRGDYAAAIDRLVTLDPRLRATPEWQVEMAELLIPAGRPGEALPLLAVAEEQLQSLRRTGSRDKLRVAVQGLRRRAQEAVNGVRGVQHSP
jgi:tetratricopeptide (TPR) repeat protein